MAVLQVEAYEVAKDIFIIDTLLHSIPHFGAVYLLKGEKLALMDTGDHTTAGNVLAGIRQLGFLPQDVAYVFCSHIHLDHSGAAGLLVPHMPRAQVVVQERGARHIADPTRLVAAGFHRAGGDPAALSLVKPVPPNQITAVKGGETFSLGKDKTVQVVATPGHSPHSVSYFYSQRKALFPGDAMGIYLGEENILMPVAPVGYDHEQILASLQTLAGMSIDALFLPHYGMDRNVTQVMRLAQQKWSEWWEVALQIIRAGDAAQLEEKLRARVRQELKPIEKRKALYAYMTGDLMDLTSQGYLAYYQRKASQG